VLVVAQVAVSFVMLIVAGLLIRASGSFSAWTRGSILDGVFTAEIGLPAIKYPVRADADRFWSALTDRVRSIPGVETAAGTTLLPLRGGGDTYFYVDGRPPGDRRRQVERDCLGRDG
jgi:putative ABC transport system permease protein